MTPVAKISLPFGGVIHSPVFTVHAAVIVNVINGYKPVNIVTIMTDYHFHRVFFLRDSFDRAANWIHPFEVVDLLYLLQVQWKLLAELMRM